MIRSELIDAQKYLECQTPLLGGLVRWLAACALVKDNSAAATEILAQAYANTPYPKVRKLVLGHLLKINSNFGINAVCSVWSELRNPALEKLILQQGWTASAPPELRFLTRLLQNDLRSIKSSDPVSIAALLGFMEDPNPLISDRAKNILLRADKPKTRDSICQIAIEQCNITFLKVLVDTQYMPSDPIQRATFLFLTQQFDRYEALDFDRRMLRSAYESAHSQLKSLIADTLRQSGRTDLLTVLVGNDFRSQAAEMEEHEAEMLVQMLIGSKEWKKLWPLIFELPVHLGIQIVSAIASTKWQPESGQEREIYSQLAAIVRKGNYRSKTDFKVTLAPAIKRAVANVSGRVNDIAFSPDRPVLAIGTGNRKVVTWNLQSAQRESLIDGFEHSVGCVTYTKGGHLVCSERTNTRTPCSVYTIIEGKPEWMHHHSSSVTALETVDESCVLSAGSDNIVRVWDVDRRQMVSERVFAEYPRSVAVSGDSKIAAIVADGGSLVSIPGLESIAGGRWNYRSKSRCAAFIPDSGNLIVGHYNGSVLHCEIPKVDSSFQENRSSTSGVLSDLATPLVGQPLGSRSGLRVREFVVHQKRVLGVSAVSGCSCIITASDDGVVNFTSADTLELRGKIGAPDGLTSLHVSPDGAFMALGDSDSRMSLWDLRILRMPKLLERPCGKSFHEDLATISAMADETTLPNNVLDYIRFLNIVLRYRYRYDIEIGEAATIQAGEYDIEIEG